MQTSTCENGDRTSSVFFIFYGYKGKMGPLCSLDATCKYKHVGVSFSHTCLKMYEYSCWNGRSSGNIRLNVYGKTPPGMQICAHRIYQVKTTPRFCQTLFDLSTTPADKNQMVPGTGQAYPESNNVISDYLRHMANFQTKGESFDSMLFTEKIQCVQLALRVLVKLCMLDNGMNLQQTTLRKIHTGFSRKSSMTPDMLCAILDSMVHTNNIVCYDEYDGILVETGQTIPVPKITSEDFRQLCLVSPGEV